MTPLRILREAVARGAPVAFLPPATSTDLHALLDAIEDDPRSSALHNIAVQQIRRAIATDDLRSCPVSHVDRLLTFTNSRRYGS